MEDRDKTKEQLINDLRKMRQRISVFEASETRCIQVEEELRKAKEFLEKVIDTARDGIMITDHTGNITVANDAFGKMIDLRKEE
ncbi:MAG: PAS domain-containing protein, partial [Deltaproteobacteria bacterium]|nr:PAS domain-containing protein [Deltaproteobacteria bacterium]